MNHQWIACRRNASFRTVLLLGMLLAACAAVAGCGPTVPVSGLSSAHAVAFSPDDQTLAVGYGGLGGDNVIRLWDLSSTSILATLRGHDAGINSLDFSEDGRMLASGSNDQTVRIWDPKNPVSAPTVLPGTAGYVQSVKFDPLGNILASGGGEDSVVRLWNMRDVSESPKLLAGDQYAGVSISISMNGTRLAAAGLSQVDVWNLKKTDDVINIKTDGSVPWAVALSPDGNELAVGGVSGSITLWDLSSLGSPRMVRRLVGHSRTVKSLAFAPSGETLVSGGEDSTIRLWDVDAGTRAPIVQRSPQGTIYSLAFSHSGKEIASAGGDGSVLLWNSANLDKMPTSLMLP